MTRKMNKALDKIFKEIDAMSDEEFKVMIEKHKNGDIAKMLVYSGAMDVIMEDLKERSKNEMKRKVKIIPLTRKNCEKLNEVMNPITELGGNFTLGMTSDEVDDYLRRRNAKRLRLKEPAVRDVIKKFNKIAGVNTCGAVQCPKCKEWISLMYRHDVQRFADKLFDGTETYFD
jgi:hypothetical protein